MQRGDFLRQERGWMIGLLVMVLLAVLLPHVDNVARSMTSIKVAGIEVAFKEQRLASQASLRSFERERTSASVPSAIPMSDMRRRLESDNRRYRSLNVTGLPAANDEFLKLYDLAIGPYIACIALLLDEGYDGEAIRNAARQFALEWHRAADLRGNHRQVRDRLSKMVTTSRTLVSSFGCEGQWKPAVPANTAVDPRAARSLEFFRLLAAMSDFLDNSLGAIQLLESVRARFQDEMNWHVTMATLYFNEDPTLEKSREHYEAALLLAEQNLANVHAEIRKSSVACVGDPPASAARPHLCGDEERYKAAVSLFKNGLAYVLAHAGAADERFRAVQLARHAVRETRPVDGLYPKGKLHYTTNLDTLAFAVMAAEASSASPDGEAIACAESAFRYLADESRRDMRAVSAKRGGKGFRREYLEARYQYEVAQTHRNTAAVLLSNLEKGGQPAGRCLGSRHQKMLEGTL